MTEFHNLIDLIMDITTILALVLGIIEVVARVIPTVGMWAPLGVIIKVLNFISEFLNNKKR